MNKCKNCGEPKEKHLNCIDGIFCGRYVSEMTGEKFVEDMEDDQ